MAKYSYIMDDKPAQDRLLAALYDSRRMMEFPRLAKKRIWEQYVGGNCLSGGSKKAVPVNVIAQYVQIVLRSLISNNPKMMLSTFDLAAKPTVSAMEDAVNRSIVKMGFAGKQTRVVLDGLFGLAIGMVALATPSDAAAKGMNIQCGEAFYERISLDNWVCDPTATDFDQMDFMGDFYEVPLETVRDSKLYTKERKDLQPMDAKMYNEQGDIRLEALQRDMLGNSAKAFIEKVRLCRVYIPSRKCVVTLAGDFAQSLVVIREQEWVGPDCGPYYPLILGPVPDTFLSKGPLQDLVDMAEAINALWRKGIVQGLRQKDFTFSSPENAPEVKRGTDGSVVNLVDPKSPPVSFSFPGANQQGLALAEHLDQKHSKQAGNLDALGGLSPQAKTLGQDKMLLESSSGQITDLQSKVMDHTARVMDGLCWFWWNHPQRTEEKTFSMPGLEEYSVKQVVTPQDRMRIPYSSLGKQIDPHSISYQTPSQKNQLLLNFVQTIYLPAMGLWQQQGANMDMGVLLQQLARNWDMPDLLDLVSISTPQQTQDATPPPGASGGAAADGAGMPQQTERTYNRVSTSARTAGGDSTHFLNAMRGVETGGASNG